MKKVLILSANPRRDLDLEKEIKSLQGIARAYQSNELKVEINLSTNPNELQELMQIHEPNIVHFCGHGSQEGLIFVDEENDRSFLVTSTEALSELFEIFKEKLECVVLNACYSEVQAKAIVSHIDYVIGMRQEIMDEAAIKFATGFYRGLAFKQSIDNCYKLGCNAIKIAQSPSGTRQVRRSISLGEDRKAIAEAEDLVMDALEEIKYQNIPEHLKPILLQNERIQIEQSNTSHSEGTLTKQEQSQKVQIIQSTIKSSSEAEYRKKIKEEFNKKRSRLDSDNIEEKVNQFLENPDLPPARKGILETEAEKLCISTNEVSQIIQKEIEQIKLEQNKYKQTLFEIIHSNKNDTIKQRTRDDLEDLRKTLQLSKAEATLIEKIVREQYDKYTQALSEYEELLRSLIDTHYPFSKKAEIELEQFIQNNNLKSGDINIIKEPIIEQARIKYKEELERYENRVDRYKKGFLSQYNHKNELDESDLISLKKLQSECKLTDEDIEKIQKSVITDNSLVAEENVETAILTIAFDLQSHSIVSGGGDNQFNFFNPVFSGKEDNIIQFWNVSNNKFSTDMNISGSSSIIDNWLGRRGMINTIAFSPNGNMIASGSNDRTIKLWDRYKGEQIYTLNNSHLKAVNSIAFHPDGNMIASGSNDATIKFWDIKNRRDVKQIYVFNDHLSIIHSVTFSPMGKLLASASSDGNIKLWDVDEKTEIYTLSGHSDIVRDVAFNPDKGKILASGGNDGAVKLWNISNGKEICTLFTHSEPIICIAFSPNGEILASGSADGIIKLWDVRHNKEFFTISAHSDWVTSIVFTSSHQLVSGSKDKTIKMWRIFRF